MLEWLSAAIPYPELLAYAQSISAFTSAPPNMPDLTLPGQPRLFFPPFPNEEKMRRGRLNAEAPLGLLGETHSVGRRKICLFFLLLSIDIVCFSANCIPQGQRAGSTSWCKRVSARFTWSPTPILRLGLGFKSGFVNKQSNYCLYVTRCANLCTNTKG